MAKHIVSMLACDGLPQMGGILMFYMRVFTIFLFFSFLLLFRMWFEKMVVDQLMPRVCNLRRVHAYED
jgi:hypothetical protein